MFSMFYFLTGSKINHDKDKVLFLCVFLLIFCFTVTYLSVFLYKLLCQDTGPNGLYGLLFDFLNLLLDYLLGSLFLCLNFYIFNGLFFFWSLHTNVFEVCLNQINVHFVVINSNPISLDKLYFNFNVDCVNVEVGKPSLIFLTVKNDSFVDVAFTSIYNVFPEESLVYLEKIQCFCYDDQIIGAGEEVELPVYFRVNSDILFDRRLVGLDDIYIFYTVFII